MSGCESGRASESESTSECIGEHEGDSERVRERERESVRVRVRVRMRVIVEKDWLKSRVGNPRLDAAMMGAFAWWRALLDGLIKCNRGGKFSWEEKACPDSLLCDVIMFLGVSDNRYGVGGMDAGMADSLREVFVVKWQPRLFNQCVARILTFYSQSPSTLQPP